MSELYFDSDNSELDAYKNRILIENFDIVKNPYLNIITRSKIYLNSNKKLLGVIYHNLITEKDLLFVVEEDYRYDLDELNLEYDSFISFEELDNLFKLVKNLFIQKI